MESKKKSKKLLLIVIAILVAVVFVIFAGVVIFRLVKLNIIADKIEVLWDNTGKMNYRIDEIYEISNIDIEKTKEAFYNEYYSYGLDKMMTPKTSSPDLITYVNLEQVIVQEFNNVTKEYKETPLLEADQALVENVTNKHIHMYKSIVENIKMRSFKEKLKITLDFSYRISKKGLGFIVEKNNVMYELVIDGDDRIRFTRIVYDVQNRANYKIFDYNITLNIVSEPVMERPDINEYTKVE